MTTAAGVSALHCANNVRFAVTGVVNAHALPPVAAVNHPVKVYPVVVGATGWVTGEPSSTVAGATLLPP